MKLSMTDMFNFINWVMISNIIRVGFEDKWPLKIDIYVHVLACVAQL